MHRFVFALLAVVAGCGTAASGGDFSVPMIDSGPPGPGPVVCDSYCVRPSDCQIAYPDVDRCPAGFLCSRTFRCASDGGTD